MKFLQRILYYFCVRCRPNRAKTIVYSFSFMALASGALLAAALLSDKGSYVRIDSTVTTIESGKPFKVQVYAGAQVPVNAVNIRLDFPADKVKVAEIDTGQSVITIWTRDPYVEGNTIVLQGGTFRRGFVGEHLIASVDFEAINTGKAEFTLNEMVLLAGDGSGSSVQLTDDVTDSVVVFVDTVDGALETEVNIEVVSDIDGDGKVTAKDIQSFLAAWGRSDRLYDFNNDNKMNFTDFAIILAHSFLR